MSYQLSVVVPAFNEAGYIQDCLNALHAHCTACDIEVEVIVIDNGSTDATAVIAERAGARVLRLERTSVSEARNVGAEATGAPFIGFIDADVVITRSWAEAFIRMQVEGGRDILTGSQYVIRDDPSWIEESWFKNLRDRYLNGGNILVSREIFLRIGGFDPRLKTGEDYDFCERAINAGARYLPDASFEAIHMGYPRTIEHFVRREIWHGEGDYNSFASAIRSPVAIIAIGYALVQLAIVISLFFNGWVSVGLIVILVLVNVSLTELRFHPRGVKQFLLNNAAHYLYFTARSLSGLRALKNRRYRY